MQSQPMLRSSDGLDLGPLAAHVKLTGSNPEVLLFDLCGVLFDDTIWTRWLFQLVSRVGSRLCYEQFTQGWEDRFIQDVNSGRREYWEAVKQYLELLGIPRAAADEICVAAKARRRQFDESIRPLPGTKSALSQLKAQGHRMAVLGNVPYDSQQVRVRLVHLGLSDFFGETISSFDSGCQDVQAARYAWIPKRLQAAPAGIWFISGHGMQLRDAAAAGLSVIAWQVSQPLKCVHSIEHLHDLVPVMGNGRNHSLAG